ncbi:MAG TPA: PH domain-containing protein [Gemmatimonadales bacterium]|nr:PH domain-containing protein [Gemmatimonadales bacterium]
MPDSFLAQQALREDLESGERFLWTGQPEPGLRFQAADLFLVPFSLFWGGFAVFWEYSVIQARAPLVFRLFGVPFVLLGLYLVVGRFFTDARRRARTFYALTDRRVIIRRDGLGAELRSLPLRGMTEVTVRDGPDGSGTILLGPSNPLYGRLAGAGWPGVSRGWAPQLECIPEVKRVYAMLRDAQEESQHRDA